MQGQNQQQAYDRGITIFSPDGRLYQVEYAREAVKRGTASIGIRTSDGVVLAVDKRIRSPLMERSSVEKIHKADDHIGIASAGHVADARRHHRLRSPAGASQPAQVRRAHRHRDADQRGHRLHPAVHTGRRCPAVRRRAHHRGHRQRQTPPVRDGPIGDALRVESPRGRRRPRRYPGVPRRALFGGDGPGRRDRPRAGSTRVSSTTANSPPRESVSPPSTSKPNGSANSATTTSATTWTPSESTNPARTGTTVNRRPTMAPKPTTKRPKSNEHARFRLRSFVMTGRGARADLLVETPLCGHQYRTV